jgi:hypothetical protein
MRKKSQRGLMQLQKLLQGAPPMAVHYQKIADVNNTKQGEKHGLLNSEKKAR